MPSTQPPKHLSFTTIELAIEEAHWEQNGSLTPAGQERFERTLAQGVVDMAWKHGLEHTLQRLCEYEKSHDIDFSFLGKCEVRFPNSVKEVGAIVEQAVVSYASNVIDYINDSEGDLAGECWLQLTEQVNVFVPRWEVSPIIARQHDAIDFRRMLSDASAEAWVQQ